MTTSILIADDSEFMTALLKRLLGETFDVLDETATDGEEAVELYKEHAPDIVIMELTMPHCNGLKATAALNQIDEGARVIVCTRKSERETRNRAEKAGAAAYITKPPNENTLVHAVQRVASSTY